MSDPIQRELDILKQQTTPPQPPPAAGLQLVRPEPRTESPIDQERRILAWQGLNQDHWIDQANQQRNFLEDRQRQDPSGLLEDEYLSSMLIGQQLDLNPSFVFEHLEQLKEQVYGEKIATPTLAKAIRNGWVTGYITNRIAMLDYQLASGAAGDRAAGIQAQIADWESKLPPEDPIVRKFFGKALVWTAENMPLFAEGAIAGAISALTVGGAAALAAGMSAATAGAGVAATGLGAPAALVTTGAAALAAFAQFGLPAFRAGSTLRMSQIMIGQSYRSLGEIKDRQGNQIRPWLRSVLAMSFGTLQGFLEDMQLETTLATMGPGMQKVFGAGVQQVMRDTVIKSVGNRALRAAAKWGVDAGTEAIEEGTQGIAQQMAENLARYIENATAGGDFAYEDVQTVISKIEEQMYMGLVVGGLMVAPGNLLSPFAESYQERAESRELTQQQIQRQVERQQLLNKLQTEIQKVVESERATAVAPAAAELKAIPPLEAAPVVEFEQPPAETTVQPGTIGEAIRQDLANAQAWAYTPEQWAQIEQARAPVERTSTISVYKDFFDPQMFPVRARIAAAAPAGFDIDAIEMTGLLLDTFARAEGRSTEEFVKDALAPGIFATPEQIAAFPARYEQLAREQATQRGKTAEEVEGAGLQARIKAAAAKGVTEFFQDGKALVYLFKTADISTAVEEFTHVMRKRLPSHLMQQAATWAGVIDGVWTEEADEKLANAFLEYLRQGLVPDEKLRGFFQRLAEWLEYIYKAIRDRMQLSPEITSVFDYWFSQRAEGVGQRLNTEPNPRPADTLNVLFQIDPALKPIDTDPAKVSDEDFLRSTEYQREISDLYFDANGNRRTIVVRGQPQEVSSRTMPVLGLRLHEGQWLIEDTFKGIYGHEIAQLRRLDPGSLELQEEDYTTGPNWEGRGDDARRYARWLQQGLSAPPITVVEGPSGQLRVTDGHRRVAAAKMVGKQIYAWVWPAMDHPQGKTDAGTGLPIRVGLTYEAAKKRAWQAGGVFDKFLFQVDPKKQEDFNKQVKEFFGTTTDLRKSAYILSTGEMLDFTGKWGKTEAVMVGGRMRHRMMGKVPTVGIIDAVNKALRMGAIRMDFDPSYSILQTMEDPTEGQYDAIDRLCKASRIVQVEKADSRTGDMLAFKEFPRPTVQNVRDFFTAAELYSPKFLFQSDPWMLKSELVVLDKMKGPMPADQVRAMLVNGGVKADELKWFGLDDFLRGKEKKTREEVLRFIVENAVRVEEVLKEYTVDAEFRETKFAIWQLPGGRNYRELLLTLPMPALRDPTFEEWYAKTHINAAPTSGVQLGVAQQRYEIEKELMPREGAFYTQHWREPNVLAHVRFNERTDAQGRRVLFLEEIQSDWHQRGKAEGYLQEPKSESELKRILDEAGYKTEWNGTNWVVTAKDGSGVPNRLAGLEPQTNQFAHDLGQVAGMVLGRRDLFAFTTGLPPPAPFSKTWHELVFKRMLRWAVEKGFDAVAWTTGEQQAERYDLSKQVDAVRWYKENAEGSTYSLGAIVKDTGLEQSIGKAIPKEKLGDYVGKELAEKILQEAPGKFSGIFKGADLKVGGEGMKGFYDKILVDFANKYGKKWGAAVGEINIAAGISKAKRLKYAEMAGPLPEKVPVHSLPITAQMRSSVKAGVFQQFLMQPDSHELATQAAVAKGDAVPDEVLAVYKDRDWAQAEIRARDRFVQEARSGQFRNVEEFVSFHDAMEEPGTPMRSYNFWQSIWQRAGGDINVAGEQGFTAVPPAEANKRFLKTVNTPEKMALWLGILEAGTREDIYKKGAHLIQGWWGFPKAIEIAYKASQSGTMPTEIWSAAYKSMKTDPERYREIEASMGDVEMQRQINAEREMPEAEETRLRTENVKLRRELKLFRLAEEEQLALDSQGKQLWELTQAEWIARWPRDERKPIGFLERHKAIVRKALQEGKQVPAEVLADYADLRKLAARQPAAALPASAASKAGMEIQAAWSPEELPLSRLPMAVKTLQKEKTRLQASIKQLEEKVKTVSEIGGWLARERRRLDLVEKRIAIQKVKERMQQRLLECFEKRQADKESWRLGQQQRTARIKRDSIIIRIRQIKSELPNMDAEVADKIRELLEGIDVAYMGKRAIAKVAKLRIALTDPDFEVPPDMLDLLDRVDQKNIGELTDAELGEMRNAIVHWVEMNREAQYYRIGSERIRAEKLVFDAISEMRPPQEVAEELQRFFPLLWEKAKEKGTTILDEFLGIGQTQWILIVENLAGKDSWLYKVLGEGIEEGRRRQLDLKFRYEDGFERGVQKLRIANLPYWLHEEQTFNNAGASMILRRGEKLALFMMSQDEDARESALKAGLGSRRRAGWRNKPRKISEGLLEEVARGLDPTEQAFVTLVGGIFEMTYRDMNEVYEQRYGHPLPKIENWYHKDTMPVGRASSLEEQKAIEGFNKRNLRPGVPKGRVRSRKGVVVPLYLNSIEYDLMQAINYAATYAGLEIPVYQAAKLLTDPKYGIREQLTESYGERTWKHLVRGLRDVYSDAEALSTVENFFAKTREMMTIAWLSLSPFTTLKIFLGFENANAYVHIDYLIRGFAEFTAHPKQVDALNQAMSPYYRDRAQRGFTRDLAEGLRSLESAGLIHAKRTMAQYGMLPIQLTDRSLVSPVMRGAVLQVLAEIQKGELSKETLLGIGHLVEGKNLQRLTPAEQAELSYRFADFVVTRTQDQRLPEYRSALSRSTSAAGFSKFFTMFGSNTNTNLNILLRAIGEFSRAKDKGKAVGRLAHIFFLVLVVTPMSMAFVSALRNHLLKRYGDDDDEQKKMWLGVLADYARELTGLSYFIRDLGDGALTILQKHRVREFSVPPVQLLNDLFEVGRRGFAWATAEDRYDRNKRMWAFLDKASEWLMMVGEIPLVMPKRYLVEYLRKKAAGE